MGCLTAAGVEIPPAPFKRGSGTGASLSPPFEVGFRGIVTFAEAINLRMTQVLGNPDRIPRSSLGTAIISKSSIVLTSLNISPPDSSRSHAANTNR